MAKAFEFSEFMNCSCLRLRRAARDATRLYDRHLRPTGLNANQLILMVVLRAATLWGKSPVTMGALAEHIGADQSTMSRNLKPLAKYGLVSVRPDPADRRARILAVTAKGRAKLDAAGPFWREAQAEMNRALGSESVQALHRLLDHSAARLAG